MKTEKQTIEEITAYLTRAGFTVRVVKATDEQMETGKIREPSGYCMTQTEADLRTTSERIAFDAGHRLGVELADAVAAMVPPSSVVVPAEREEWRCGDCGAVCDGVECQACERREGAKDRLYEKGKERRHGG